jgi:hypothetical protein
MAFRKKWSPGTCDSCGEPVICPERPGVHMYLFHLIEADPDVEYLSLVRGTEYKWTIESPATELIGLDSTGVAGVDGQGTLWLFGYNSAGYEFLAVWVDNQGNTGTVDLEAEWDLGLFTVGDETTQRVRHWRSGVGSESVDFTGGSGLYFPILEIYGDASASPVTSDSQAYWKILLGHVTKDSNSITEITQTAHVFDEGELLYAESFLPVSIVGCETNALLLIERRNFFADTAALEFWWGTSLIESLPGTVSAVAVNGGHWHLYGDYAVVDLLLPSDPDEFTLVNEGVRDSSGDFPLVSADISSEPLPFANGVGRVTYDLDEILFDIDGNTQIISGVSFVADPGNHLRRDYYSQQWNGENNFTETNEATGDPDTGDIDWPAGVLPYDTVPVYRGSWFDYYEFARGPITGLLPIAEFVP